MALAVRVEKRRRRVDDGVGPLACGPVAGTMTRDEIMRVPCPACGADVAKACIPYTLDVCDHYVAPHAHRIRLPRSRKERDRHLREIADRLELYGR